MDLLGLVTTIPPLIDKIIQLLNEREIRDIVDQEQRDEILEACLGAYHDTKAYIADRRENLIERDRDKEMAISKAWTHAGLLINKLNTPEAEELYIISFKKADYWSDPGLWEQNLNGNEIDISLTTVEKKIEAILLANKN